MIRLLIAAGACVCGGLAGLAASDMLKKRCSYIEEMMNILRQMSVYIRYDRTELSKLLTAVDGKERVFVTDSLIAAADSGAGFETEWENCVKRLPYLRGEDKEPLYRLAKLIGKSDADGQTALISCAEESLDIRLIKAQEEYKQKGRLVRTLGLLAGAAAGIMLI